MGFNNFQRRGALILSPIGSCICDLRLTCCRKIIIVDGAGVAPYIYLYCRVVVGYSNSSSRVTTTAAAFSAAHPKNVGGQCTDDGGCGGGNGAVYRRCRFPPQTFVVFLCLCVCVCVRLCVLVYPTRRDANIIILTFYTPRPSTNAWVSLCFERSVERDTL